LTHQVNLDALIPREDFEVVEKGAPAVPTQTLQIRNLERTDFFYAVLRKPDFQRETSDWAPDKITAFVRSFLEGDLIPALILWQSGSQIFVIDGAHRLSALVAGVHDDFGDGPTSRTFFDGIISDEQMAAGDYTRRMIKRELGSYADHQFAIANPEKAKPAIVARAKSLGSLALQLQWVKGDASKAEESFFKINQQAAPIDKTELRLLQSRKLPNAMAARAIVRSGTGHKYWSRFSEERRSEIESQAKAINELLFAPSLKQPIKTLDLPVAGRGYSSQTLPLVFEFVDLANRDRGRPDLALVPDQIGDETLRYLKNCRNIVNRISGTHPSSLGLHPAVYFYSATGRYQPTAFLAVVAMIRSFVEKEKLLDFTKVRRRFEDFLLVHRVLVNQVTVKYGSGAKGYARLEQLLTFIVDEMLQDKSESAIIEDMAASDVYSFLQPAERSASEPGKDFGKDAKSAVFLRDALKDPLRCAICGGLIHRNAISIDHIIRKSEGGTADPDNGQLTHPFCNTTVKN
jgi:hypothetical protein